MPSTLRLRAVRELQMLWLEAGVRCLHASIATYCLARRVLSDLADASEGARGQFCVPRRQSRAPVASTYFAHHLLENAHEALLHSRLRKKGRLALRHERLVWRRDVVRQGLRSSIRGEVRRV